MLMCNEDVLLMLTVSFTIAFFFFASVDCSNFFFSIRIKIADMITTKV